MNSAEIHTKFFPQARPICAFTRADIDRMASEMKPRKPRVPPPDPVGPVRAGASVGEGRIISVAAAMFGVSARDLVGRNRSDLLVYAREYASVRLRMDLRRSYFRIGELLRRDHKTIVNLVHPKKGKRRTMAGRI